MVDRRRGWGWHVGLIAFFLAAPSTALAWNVQGLVICDVNGNGVHDSADLPAGGIVVKSTALTVTPGATFTATTGPGAGFYSIKLPDHPEDYRVELTTGLPPGSSVVSPASGAYGAPPTLPIALSQGSQHADSIDFLIDGCVAATATPAVATATATPTAVETVPPTPLQIATPTATPTDIEISTATPIVEKTPTPTPTKVDATATPTETAAATPTPAGVSETATPVVATATPTPIVDKTATPTPTKVDATATPTATEAATPTPAGVGETATPTATPTATQSANVTPTVTESPTPTPTVTVTATPAVASATPTGSPVPTSTSTTVPTSSQLPTSTPASTATPTPGVPTVTATPSPGTTPGNFFPNHFQCYEIDRSTISAIKGIPVEDRFGVTAIDVAGTGRVKRLCNPADKNGEDPTAPADPNHLVGYVISKRTPRLNPYPDQIVTNQFGSATVSLTRPILLMVPSAKSLAGAPAPLPRPGVDHFQCYGVTNAGGARVDGVKVVDQFTSLTLDVKRPSRLCVAVDKRGEGVLVPDAALMCYEVRSQSGTPRFTGPPGPVYVDNQFGPDTIKVTRPTELCVPSSVTDAPARRRGRR